MRNRRYETVFMVPADLDEGKLKELLDRLDAVLERSGGILVKREDWGVRKLAYEINRHTKGRYFLLDFAGSPEIISELERNIKMIESILRFLTVKKADEVDLEAVRKEQAEEKEKAEAQKASERERAAAAEAAAAKKAKAEEAAKAEAAKAEAAKAEEAKAEEAKEEPEAAVPVEADSSAEEESPAEAPVEEPAEEPVPEAKEEAAEESPESKKDVREE